MQRKLHPYVAIPRKTSMTMNDIKTLTSYFLSFFQEFETKKNYGLNTISCPNHLDTLCCLNSNGPLFSVKFGQTIQQNYSGNVLFTSPRKVAKIELTA